MIRMNERFYEIALEMAAAAEILKISVEKPSCGATVKAPVYRGGFFNFYDGYNRAVFSTRWNGKSDGNAPDMRGVCRGNSPGVNLYGQGSGASP